MKKIKIDYSKQIFIFQHDKYIQQSEYLDLISIPCSIYNKKTKNVEVPFWMISEVESKAGKYDYQYDIFDTGLLRFDIDAILLSSLETESNCLLLSNPETEYLPFQKAAIVTARGRKNILIADEMGLGKTVEAIGILNDDININKVLIVCPASLKLNWKKELEAWLVGHHNIQIIDKKFILGDVSIINYAKLKKYAADLNKLDFDAVIFDESHYLKSAKAIRTKLCFGSRKVIHADRRIFLTGTPILNRPIELFPLLRECGVEKNWKRFVKTFCDAKEINVWHGYGQKTTVLDVSGSSNEGQLQKILRSTIMIRRIKTDVLPQLPKKIRQIVCLPENGSIKQVKKERMQFAEAMLQPNMALSISTLSEIRRENALKKIKFAKQYIDNLLEQKEKVVIFAWHLEVIEELRKALLDYNPLIITGKTSLENRDKAVEKFQNGDNKILLGNLKAAGTGLTLTAASDVVFLEMDWTPGINNQAEDRIHRIGQNEVCHIHYLVYDGTVDAYIAKKVSEKKKVIDSITNISLLGCLEV